VINIITHGLYHVKLLHIFSLLHLLCQYYCVGIFVPFNFLMVGGLNYLS
jgi:hypothetical protein